MMQNSRPYIALILIGVLLLLLLPLPALGTVQSAVGGPPSPPSTGRTTTQAGSTTTANPSADDFRILDEKTGQVYTYPARDLLIYIVAYEMYASFHEEALKAQAVAAYTYFSVKREASRSAGAASDFSDVPGEFPYALDNLRTRYGENFDTYYAKIAAAVDAVYGQKICYGGKPIQAYYHAISAGSTESAGNVWSRDLPYLVPVDSVWDKLAPKYETVNSATPEQLKTALCALEENVVLPNDPNDWNVACEYSDAGYVLWISVGDVRVTGRRLRGELGLHSAAFTVTREGENFVFTCHGYGHGVGMSQYGANALAGDGYTYDRILQYYYSGVTVS